MLSLLVITLAAFLAGAINAFAGGGTFLTFPALTGAAGLSDKVANMTSTIGLWPGSAASVAAALGEFRRIPRRLIIGYGIISLIGGTLGSILLLVTSQETFALVIPWLLAFATVIFGFSKPIARWSGHKHGSASPAWRIIVGVIQLAVAIYGGYFGAGIGVLMLAGLSFAGIEDVYELTALKVLLATLINGVAAIIFLSHGVNWTMALIMAVASTAGGFLGMAVARRVPQEKLRLLILGIGIALTAAYFVKNYA